MVLFLAFDVALITVALSANQLTAGLANRTPSPPASAPAPVPEPTVDQPVTSAAGIPQRLLAAVDRDIAWRGTVGSCPDGPSALEYTSDGGATWKTSDPSLETGANTLIRAVPSSGSQANFVTLNAECSPQLVGTFVAGDAWEDYSSNLGSYWYVDPADRGAVYSPNGAIRAPCESVASLSTSPIGTAILCTDQTLYEIAADATEWSAGVSIPGAVALDGSDDGYLLAVASRGGCEGTSVVSLIGGVLGPPVGCVGEAPPPGETAVSVSNDGTLWLWTGENFVRSIDGGETWS